MDDAKLILKTAEGELRAWLLVMFNVAGYQSDVSELAPAEVD